MEAEVTVLNFQHTVTRGPLERLQVQRANVGGHRPQLVAVGTFIKSLEYGYNAAVVPRVAQYPHKSRHIP